jgi:RNA-directed DNA polymerase
MRGMQSLKDERLSGIAPGIGFSCCESRRAVRVLPVRVIMSRLRLTVNEEKTHICLAPRDPFGFLGYTLGRCYSPKDGHAYIGPRPSIGAAGRERAAAGDATERGR